MKKALSMLLVLVLVVSLLGCGRQTGESAETEAVEAAPQAQNTAEEETENVETELVFYSKKE